MKIINSVILVLILSIQIEKLHAEDADLKNIYLLKNHHSILDHVVAGDLMQASAVMAAVIYQAATRKEMLPRKVLPKALPKKSKLPDILESLK